MKYMFAALLMAVCAACGEDHVTVMYRPGFSRTDRAITLTIDQSFDKSGVVIPEVFKRLKTISGLETTGFVVPDAACIKIVAELEGQRLEASSCHTLFEANEQLVVKSTGITRLDGATRKKVLSGEPKHFLKFRALWEEALALAMKEATTTFLPDVPRRNR